MTGSEIARLRFENDLLGGPKRTRRARAVAAMDELFRKGYDEADVRAVVSTSASSWQRARAWYRERHSLGPDEPLSDGPIVEIAVSPSRLRRYIEETTLPPGRARWGTGTGWSWIGQIQRRAISDRLREHGVIGADVGDPIGDAHYLAFLDRREAARVTRLEKERESA